MTFLFSTVFIFGQTPCEFDDQFANLTQAELDSWADFEASYLAYKGNGGEIGTGVIPTVVHIFYEDVVDSLSQDSVLQIIEEVNFQLSGGLGGEDTGVELAIASVDPNGNCSDGIVYIKVNNSVSINSSNQSVWKPLSTWDNSSYFNIWVKPNTDPASTSSPPASSGGASATIPWLSFVQPHLDGLQLPNNAFKAILDISHEDSRTLIHEVGHYLGLVHVWGTYVSPATCTHCHSIADSLVKGDFVGDTNPCRSIDFFIDCSELLDDCTSSNADCVDLNLSYPKENFMSYATNCRTEFTAGQCVRIWATLNRPDRRDLLDSDGNQACTGTYIARLGHNVEITANESWTTSSLMNNGKIMVSGNLTVKAGNQLTLGEGVELHFCNEGELIIEQGATLINSGTLTNTCGTQWNGIRVLGDENSSQGSILNHPNHGVLICNAGSVIENAETGVHCSGGGMFFGNNATLINNTTGVRFNPYSSVGNYQSSLNNCNFFFDEAFPFSCFMEVNGVKNITVNGSTFRNLGGVGTNPDIFAHGCGIFCQNGSINLGSSISYDPGGNPVVNNRCFFEGLGFGIVITKVLDNKPFEINHAQFSNCFGGIYNGGMNASKIINCDFQMGNVPDPALIDGDDQSQIGLHLQGDIIAMEVQENSFITNGDPEFNVTGVISDNIGSHNNFIRSNSFSNCDISNISTRKNSSEGSPFADGLRYTCNSFGSNFFDITVPDQDLNGVDLGSKVNNQQGTVDDQIINSAGNLFSHPSGSIGDFNNEHPADIQYHYNDSGLPNEEPTLYSNIVLIPSAPASCSEEFCAPPCINPTTGPTGPTLNDIRDHFLTGNDVFDDAFDDYNDGNTSNAEEELLEEIMTTAVSTMDELTDSALFMLSFDTLNLYNTEYLWWIEQQESIAADVWLAGEHAAEGNWTLANTTLQNIPIIWNLQGNEYLEWQAIVNIFGAIETDGLYTISESNKTYLINLANQNLGNASVLANSLLGINNVKKTPHYFIPYMTPLRNRSSLNENNIGREFFSLYPNPATNKVFISWKGELKEVDVVIQDQTGKLIKRIDQVGNESTLEIGGIKNGIYIIELQSKDAVLQNMKLVIAN